MNNFADLFAMLIAFIVGGFITQIVLFAVFGAIDLTPLTQNMSGEWKSQMDSIIILFGLIDVCGGMGFLIAINSLINGIK